MVKARVGTHPKAASIKLLHDSAEELKGLCPQGFLVDGYTTIALAHAYELRRYYPGVRIAQDRGTRGLTMWPDLDGNPKFYPREKREFLKTLRDEITAASQHVCGNCGDGLAQDELIPDSAAMCKVCIGVEAVITSLDGTPITNHPRAAEIELQRLAAKQLDWSGPSYDSKPIQCNGWCVLLLEYKPKIKAVSSHVWTNPSFKKGGLSIGVNNMGDDKEERAAIRRLTAQGELRSRSICRVCGTGLETGELSMCNPCKSFGPFMMKSVDKKKPGMIAMLGFDAVPIKKPDAPASGPSMPGSGPRLGCAGIAAAAVAAYITCWHVIPWVISLG